MLDMFCTKTLSKLYKSKGSLNLDKEVQLYAHFRLKALFKLEKSKGLLNLEKELQF